MPSTLHVIACALVALVVWTVIGWPIARRTFGHAFALPLAPVTGWAVHDVVAVPLFYVVPFDAATVVAGAVGVGAVAAFACRRSGDDRDGRDSAIAPFVRIPWTAWAAAAALAAACTVAVLPKVVGDAVYVGIQTFDHAKVAMIDDIVRLGMPPGNPFIAPERGGGRLSYYYLWHFGAAQLARVLPVSGWEADAAMTFFSAFTSLAVLMALAARIAGRGGASLVVVLLAATASSRRVWLALFGPVRLDAWVAPPGGFGGWLFQAPWVPQHLVSTSCVALAVLAIDALRRRVSASAVVVLGLLAAAAFESSTWIGGVVQAVVWACVVPWALTRVEAGRRLRVAGAFAAAGLVAAVVAAPFLVDQLAAATSRQPGSPIVLQPWPVLGDAVPPGALAWLDAPAFWLVLLPMEWTAVYLFGVVGIARSLARRGAADDSRVPLALAALAALASTWVLVSTLADNNDLGWRAALLASVLLIPFAAAAITRLAVDRRRGALIVAAIAIALGLPETVSQIDRNLHGHANPDGRSFARAPALWAAVRRHAGPDERVANNPLALARMTPWPANLGWSLFGDRRSCYATWELVQVYSSIPHDRLRAIDRRFVRVFAGAASPGDVQALARTFDCEVVVVTPDDGAWRNDPFARSADYRLVDDAADRWRIYRRVGAPEAQP